MAIEKSIASLLTDQEYSNNKNSIIIDFLKQSLIIHWQQQQELLGQAEHAKRWGYNKLADIFFADSLEERDHAKAVLERLEFFDVTVPYTAQPGSWPRHDYVGIIKFDLTGARNAAKVENMAIKAAREVADEQTAQVFIPLMQGSEEYIIRGEAWLRQIDQIGLDNWLTLYV